jgi:hypothetical protein
MKGYLEVMNSAGTDLSVVLTVRFPPRPMPIIDNIVRYFDTGKVFQVF